MSNRPSQLGLVSLLLATSSLTTRGQGTVDFRNLNFEQAVITPDPTTGILIDFSPAFPFWQGWIGANPQRQAFYNSRPIDTPMLGLQGIGPGMTNGRISGNYTATLFPNPSLGWGDVSLSQTALVPSDSTTLYFRTKPGNSLRVSLGGSDLPFVPLTLTTNWQSYGADIRSYAGTVAELRFTALSETFLDDIRFTTLAIPEPGPLALLVLGAGVFGLVTWGRRERNPQINFRSLATP